jgi:uncharacterized coiled-coil protein SlyX
VTAPLTGAPDTPAHENRVLDYNRAQVFLKEDVLLRMQLEVECKRRKLRDLSSKLANFPPPHAKVSATGTMAHLSATRVKGACCAEPVLDRVSQVGTSVCEKEEGIRNLVEQVARTRSDLERIFVQIVAARQRCCLLAQAQSTFDAPRPVKSVVSPAVAFGAPPHAPQQAGEISPLASDVLQAQDRLAKLRHERRNLADRLQRSHSQVLELHDAHSLAQGQSCAQVSDSLVRALAVSEMQSKAQLAAFSKVPFPSAPNYV